jgi:hypothetical protein
MDRLTIVVPYRGREQHLNTFVPHVRAYFARDIIAAKIPYRVLIVEQDGDGLPFNRGAIKNVGFVLGANGGDYTAFHDVDYLPIWADYRSAETLTAIVWYGSEARPIIPGRPESIKNTMNEFVGGVILIPNALFKQVNGYANIFWGWGFEDADLAQRVMQTRNPIMRRKGTFQPLDHANEGFQLDYKPTRISDVNRALYVSRWRDGALPPKDDGLSSLDFMVIDRRPIPDARPERPAHWEVVKVRLNMAPRAEQTAACKGNP